MNPASRLRRLLLPAGVFIVVVTLHFVWKGLHPETDPAQGRWLEVGAGRSWLQSYLQSGSYWLGYSYAVSLAFAASAYRRYRESRAGADRTLAIGGLGVTGFLAVAGCFLIGCCGSPMLAVYLGLFGAAFLPFAGPLVAGLTTIFLILGWRWMTRWASTRAACGTPGCGCEGSAHPLR